MNTKVTFVEGQPLPLLVSDVIPPAFAHGFTTRNGGVSQPPYQSFNLGMRWGDAPEAVVENRRRLTLAAGARTLHLVSQVHGNAVAVVGTGDDPGNAVRREADAVVTDVPGAAVAVFVADCVPLVMVDPRTGACAAVHAGWRGVVAGVAKAALETLRDRFGAAPADVRVAMGPSIGPCCFEVGPEVKDAFAAVFPRAEAGVIIDGNAGKPHVHLRRALALQLEALGVPTPQIDSGGACTRCDPDRRFYSYRRDGKTGQHLAFVLRSP